MADPLILFAVGAMVYGVIRCIVDLETENWLPEKRWYWRYIFPFIATAIYMGAFVLGFGFATLLGLPSGWRWVVAFASLLVLGTLGTHYRYVASLAAREATERGVDAWERRQARQRIPKTIKRSQREIQATVDQYTRSFDRKAQQYDKSKRRNS